MDMLLLGFIFAVLQCIRGEDYAVVIDAGSTGSRSFVYRYDTDVTTGNRNITVFPGRKVTPGLSSFGNHAEEVVSYLAPLLYDAANVISSEHHHKTKVFIKATAGMRLIPEDEQANIWSNLIKGIINDPLIPFRITPQDFGTIDGYYEAYYAVLASNYIAGRIDGNLRRVPGTTMIGAMDMGGSSTQLIFYNGTDDDLGTVSAEQFWSHSWLSYGVVKVRERLWEQLSNQYIANNGAIGENGRMRIRNPCTFIGHEEMHGDNILFEGTGEPETCLAELMALIWPEGVCEPGTACPVDGIQHPPVRHEFYGMSVYFFALDCVKHFVGEESLPNWPNPTVGEIKNAALKFCSIEWQTVSDEFTKNKHPFTRTYQLAQRCVESLYIVTLLEKGFGFHEEYNGITIALEVEGTEVEWTLGYALSEVQFFPELPILEDVEELVDEPPFDEADLAREVIKVLEDRPTREESAESDDKYLADRLNLLNSFKRARVMNKVEELVDAPSTDGAGISIEELEAVEDLPTHDDSFKLDNIVDKLIAEEITSAQRPTRIVATIFRFPAIILRFIVNTVRRFSAAVRAVFKL